MQEECRPDPFLARSRELSEARCVVGDVYRALMAYQEMLAQNSLDNRRRAQRLLNLLFLANEDMREWAAREVERRRREIDLDADFAQLVEGVKDASDQIQRAIVPLLRETISRTGSYPANNPDDQEVTPLPSETAPLLANILSCLALRAQVPPPLDSDDEQA